MEPYKELASKRARELDDAQRQLTDARWQIREMETAAADANARAEKAEPNTVPQCTENTRQNELLRAELEQQSTKKVDMMKAKLNERLREEKAKTTELETEYSTKLQDLESKYEKTVAKLKIEHSAELEIKQKEIIRLNGIVTTLRSETETLRKQDLRHVSELKEAMIQLRKAEYAHEFCEEDLRLAKECTNITAEVTPGEEEGKTARIEMLLVELESSTSTLEQLRGDLRDSESRYNTLKSTSAAHHSQMRKDLERASGKHVHNESLLRSRDGDIKRLEEKVDVLIGEKDSLEQRLRWANQYNKDYRKQLKDLKNTNDAQRTVPVGAPTKAAATPPSQPVKRSLGPDSFPPSNPKRSKTNSRQMSDCEDDDEPTGGARNLVVGRGRQTDSIKVSPSQRKT